MTYVILGLRYLHIMSMAGWFGAALWVPGDIRRSLAAGPDHIKPMQERVKRMNAVAAIMAWLTILSGFGLVGAMGGKPPRAIVYGLVLGLIMLGVGGGGIGRTWSQISAKLDEGADAAAIDPLRKRLGMMYGIFHLLWMVTLAIMVFRHVIP